MYIEQMRRHCGMHPMGMMGINSLKRKGIYEFSKTFV
jgi:hypothetical protein